MLVMPMTASTVVAARHAVPVAGMTTPALNMTASSLSADRTNNAEQQTSKLPASSSTSAFTPGEVHAVCPDGTGSVAENADAHGGVIRWYLG